METIFVKVLFGDHYWCNLTPFVWWLFPKCVRNYDHGSRVQVTAKVPYNQKGEQHTYDFFTRRYQVGMRIKFLCFDLHFFYWKRVKEVCEIYPNKYDADTDPDWKEKYHRLVESGYFE